MICTIISSQKCTMINEWMKAAEEKKGKPPVFCSSSSDKSYFSGPLSIIPSHLPNSLSFLQVSHQTLNYNFTLQLLVRSIWSVRWRFIFLFIFFDRRNRISYRFEYPCAILLPREVVIQYKKGYNLYLYSCYTIWIKDDTQISWLILWL